ncbi:universal stress protein [Capillimicrobium parvum]|uniref:Universal stress protein n=1 Tax=Capillimicrobium parvum TaxID=2884022 RepID=A0A9E6XVA3_9ACTN|nr:universal stress protein [Capillimicrobium parvum]UGS34416.1 Universal stress protein [Capillimicrobium parvum]
MFSTIVIGFDASPQAHDALALTQALAGPATEIVVCCVHPPEISDDPISEESLAVQAHERLKEARARLGDRPNTRYEVRGAFSAGAGLHDETERSAADLLVVGSSHRGAIGRVIPGSVTRQVLHAAPCAVAVAPAGLRDHPPELRRIGIAFTDQPESAQALQRAAQIARDHQAKLTVLTVVDITGVADGWASAWIYPDVRDDMHEAAKDAGTRALAGLEGVDATLEVIDGLTAQELVLASGRLDLLVMGSRGYGPLRRALVGTVAGRVAEAAACPVLITPRAASASASLADDPGGGEQAGAAVPPAGRG